MCNFHEVCTQSITKNVILVVHSFRIYSILSLELSSVGWIAQPPEVALLLGPLHWKAPHWSLSGGVLYVLVNTVILEF